VAHTVLLDLKLEGQLFDTLMESVNRALEKEKGLLVKEQHNILCCTEAIHTTLCQHMSKEEELVTHSFTH
jgi:zinc finger-like protein